MTNNETEPAPSLETLTEELKTLRAQRDALLYACNVARPFVEPLIYEPGRSALWNFIEAIKAAEKDRPAGQ